MRKKEEYKWLVDGAVLFSHLFLHQKVGWTQRRRIAEV